MKSYKQWNPAQSFLLPPSPMDWLPADHLVYFLLDVVGEMDLRAIEAKLQCKDARGTRPYPPQMMVALLLYGYCVGVFSSRKLEKGTYEDVALRVLAGGHHPDHTRISEFRRQHLEALQELFLQVLKLCHKAGLVKLGHVALDGTKIQGNASEHKAMSYERMVELEERLRTEIDDLLQQAEQIDVTEDARYGQGVRGDELPEELHHRQSRLAVIREAKTQLEEEAKQVRALALREQAEKARKRSETHQKTWVRKGLATVARKSEAKATSLVSDDEQLKFMTQEGLPQHRPQTTVEGKPKPKAQRNFTDPDSRIVRSGSGYVQGYNCQAVVDDVHQIIVAQAVTNQSPDNGNLLPMLEQVASNCGQVPQVMSADKGYWSPLMPRAAEQLGTEVLVSTERRKHWQVDNTVTHGPPPSEQDELGKMRHKLRTDRGRKLYARRKTIVEPVFGQMKECRAFRRFLLRGLLKVAGEWSLVSTGHNLLKLYRATWKQTIGRA
jgi:transposase